MSDSAEKNDKKKSNRISVSLIPDAERVVEDGSQGTGMSKNDVINRAILVYALLENQRKNGHELMFRAPDGTLERVHIV